MGNTSVGNTPFSSSGDLPGRRNFNVRSTKPSELEEELVGKGVKAFLNVTVIFEVVFV